MPAKKHAIAAENIYIEVDESVSDDTQDASYNDNKFTEAPQRMSSRVDPELIKRFNNPDYLEREEQKLKNEKSKKVIHSKKSTKVPQKLLGPSPEKDLKRDYQYNKDYKKLIKPGMQKAESENPMPSTKQKKDEMKNETSARKHRKFYKDDQYVAKDEIDNFEEEKIEIVYEEVEDDEEIEPKCRTDVSLDDFRVRRIIDKGSFGEVFLTD